MNRYDTVATASTVAAFVALGSGSLAWLCTENAWWAATGALLFVLLGIVGEVAGRKK
jgi:hypothetical protein